MLDSAKGETALTLPFTAPVEIPVKKLCVSSICRTRINESWKPGKEFEHSDVRDLTGLPASATKAISAFLSAQVLKLGGKHIERIHDGTGGKSGLYRVVSLPIPDEGRAAPVFEKPRQRKLTNGPISATGFAAEALAFAIRVEQFAHNANDPSRYNKMTVDELFAERKAIDAVIERRVRKAAK